MRTLFAAVAVLLVAGCSAPVRPYTCRLDPQATASADPQQFWSCNRDVLQRIVRKKPYSLREFRSASTFFARLTGLQVASRRSHLGPIPVREIRADLVTLDAWYAANRSRLEWDRASGQLVLNPLAPIGGPD